MVHQLDPDHLGIGGGHIYYFYLRRSPAGQGVGSLLLRGEKSRIENLGDLILTVPIVIGPTKFIGDLKLDPWCCSGPSRGATSASSLWWMAIQGSILHHKDNLG